MNSRAVREQGKELQYHRQFQRMYFKANDMDFVFQWLMGSAVHGGAGVGESFYTASHIKDGNPQSWEDEWAALAKRVQARAESALQMGHIISGQEAYLRAAVYYRAVLASMLPNNPMFKSTLVQMQECFQRGSRLLNPPVERIEIPFQGATLPGYFQKAAQDNRLRPTLLMIGGSETYAEDMYYFIAPAAIKRGYNFVTVDLTGQGDTPFRGLYFRPDFETPMKAVLDYVLSQVDVNPQQLAVYGISAGGYMVPRAAAHEPRIKACVANSIIYDMFQIISKTPIPKIKGVVKILAKWKAPFQVRMIQMLTWRWGLTDLNDFAGLVAKNRDLSYDPAEITCPTLILIGEGEYQNPEICRQQFYALERLSNPCKKLVIGPMDEGAAHHCMGENPSLMSALVFDWLDDVFATASG